MLLSDKKENASRELTGTVLRKTENSLTIQDEKDIIYTFNVEDLESAVGDNVLITYTGLLDKDKEYQDINLIDCITLRTSQDFDTYSLNREDDIFSQFYILARDYVDTMTLDEKIGQILLVRYPEDSAEDAIKNYHVGGFVFYEKDFRDKNKATVQSMISQAQKLSKTPLLTAVDEEGGTVVRVSSNPALKSEPFKSPSELYQAGGFDLLRDDTLEKSALLNDLGLNVNLAPVVDVSTDPTDYIHDRTLGENATLTSEYAKTVIKASKTTPVSYVLKHFPGYSSNDDTHIGPSADNRTLESIRQNDLPPFEAGIREGAEAVLVSHNTITNLDPDNPASLSSSVHNLLRNNLDFTGVIITDDLAMGATSSIPNVVEKAILAGNDIIMVTDYEASFNEIKDAVENGRITEDKIDSLAFKSLAWKFYKGLMYTETK